jgi:putative transposase
VQAVVERFQMSVRRACGLVGLAEASWYYRPQPRADEAELRARLQALAAGRPAFGSPRMTVLLRREFGTINHKRVERLYGLEGLQLARRAKRRRRAIGRVTPAEMPTAPGQRGSMDFVHDVLANGRRIRVLTVVDDFTRECLALEVDSSLTGQRVARTLGRLRESGKLPSVMVCENGTEFTSRAMLTWSHATATHLHFIQPGKPTQNAYIESFNGKLRH